MHPVYVFCGCHGENRTKCSSGSRDERTYSKSGCTYVCNRTRKSKGCARITKWGTNPNFDDEDGNSPLCTAAWKGNTDIAQLLINNGAAVSREDGKYSPLHHASSAGSTKMITLLLDNGARIEAVDLEGMRPLEIALYEECIEAAELLLRRGGKFDESMWYCVRLNTLDLVLSYGAKINARLSKNMTLLHKVIEDWAPELAIELIKRGADTTLVDEEGLTPLHYLASFEFDPSDANAAAEHLELVRRLIPQHEILSNEGQTALDIAIKNKNWETVTLFIKSGAMVHNSDNPNRGWGLAKALGEAENLLQAINKSVGFTTKKEVWNQSNLEPKYKVQKIKSRKACRLIDLLAKTFHKD